MRLAFSLAIVLTLLCCGTPADAGGKRVFEGLLYSGTPDLDAAYGFWHLSFVSRTTYNSSDWTDSAGLPPAAWYNTVAAQYTNARGYLLIDIESWPETTQAERLATAAKFVTVYREMKSRRPDLTIGFYAYPLTGNFWDIIQSDASSSPGGVGYTAWQAKNDDFAAMWAVVDVIFPSLYYPYNSATHGTQYEDGATHFFENRIADAIRCRNAYGHGQKIYPYVYMRSTAGGAPLDDYVWALMTRIAHTQADGMILWGGYQETWSASANWWGRFLKDFPYGDRTLLKPRSARN